MAYLSENSSKFLSKEQTKIIINLQNQLNSKLTSNAFINIKNNYTNNILALCKGETEEEKLKGIELLNAYFYELYLLNEQFDILCLYGGDIIKAIMNKPNPPLIDIYYKFSYFFMFFFSIFDIIIFLTMNAKVLYYFLNISLYMIKLY